jgi:hypothetical protein
MTSVDSTVVEVQSVGFVERDNKLDRTVKYVKRPSNALSKIDVRFSEILVDTVNKRKAVRFFKCMGLEQSFSTSFNSRHTEQSSKIVKEHHQFFEGEILSLKTSNKIVFKSPIATILIIMLFLKNVDHGFLRFFIPLFSRFFSIFPQTLAAHLKTLRVISVCRGTPVENRWSR